MPDPLTALPSSGSVLRVAFKSLSRLALWTARVVCSLLFIAAMLWPLPRLVKFFDEGWWYESEVLMNAPPWLICVPLLYLLVLGAASWLLQKSWQRPLCNVLFLAWFLPLWLAIIAGIEHRGLWLMLNASQIQSTSFHQSLVLKHYFIPKAHTSATRHRISFQENWVEVSHPLDPQRTLRLESYMVDCAFTNPGTALCITTRTGRFGLQWVADVSPCKPGHTMMPLSSAGLALTRPVLRTHQTGRLESLDVDGAPSTSPIDATDPQPPSDGARLVACRAGEGLVPERCVVLKCRGSRQAKHHRVPTS